MTLDPKRRELPVLEIMPPSRMTGARPAVSGRSEERLGEFRPEAASAGAMPSFHVWTLGCQMNKSDAEEMAGSLAAIGCMEAPDLESADLVVINTCAIREQAEQKVIGRQGVLAALKEQRPGMRVVLTGCAVRERDRAGLEKRFPAVDLFLRPDEEPELVARLGLDAAQGAIGRGEIGMTTVVNQAVVGVADRLPAVRADKVAQGAVLRRSAITAWLPIIYGCDKACTYCIVPYSRGPERSRPFDEIVEEARHLAAAGYREVTLLGQNVNSYGHDLPAEERFAHVDTERWSGRKIDLHQRPDLAELIRAIDAIRVDDGPAHGKPAIPRLRFVTSHPWDLSDRLIAAMAESPSICEHLHLPVQSGSDEVLKRMGRQYTIEHYLERLAALRAAIPGITFSTDVIVGFCGETEEQFEQTLALLETARYEQVFAAAYSQRPGTPATKLPDDVPAAEKRRRLNALLALQERIGFEQNRVWLGREVSVLLDTATDPTGRIDHRHDDEGAEGGRSAEGDPTDDGRDASGAAALREARERGLFALAGRSRESKLVHVAGPEHLRGEIVRVRVEHAGPFSLRGSLV